MEHTKITPSSLGNIIEYAFMQQVGRIPQNTHIISNFMEFDSNGVSLLIFTPFLLPAQLDLLSIAN